MTINDRLEKARQYAEQAKQRNKPPCDCETCKRVELEPAVIRITERWNDERFKARLL